MTKNFTDWMDEAARKGKNYEPIRRLKPKDGHTLSIQASKYHYCEPRSDRESYNQYEKFEIGFPTFRSTMLMPFAEEPERPTDTVYAYVPKEIIERLIKRHGGVVGFQE